MACLNFYLVNDIQVLIRNLIHIVLVSILNPSNMESLQKAANTSPSACRQNFAPFQGSGKNPSPKIDIGKLESVIVDLVKKALSDPGSWPGGLPPTPAFSIGPSTPPLDAVELEKRLVQAADTGSQSHCTDIEDVPSPGISQNSPAVVNNVMQGGQPALSDAADATKSSARQEQSKPGADAEGTSAAKARGSVLGFKKVMEMYEPEASTCHS